jgi:hypothetical protein
MNGEDPAATIEISPLYAASAVQLRARDQLPARIAAGETVYLG